MSGRHRRERNGDPRWDQAEAAEREARRGLQRQARAMGVEVEEHPNDNPDDPTMTAFLAKLRAALEAGELRRCAHVGSPQPVFLNAWDRPWTVRCIDCQERQPRLVGEEDQRCDLCGQIDATGIWPAQIGLGYMVVSLGRCDDCTPEHIRTRSR